MVRSSNDKICIVLVGEGLLVGALEKALAEKMSKAGVVLNNFAEPGISQVIRLKQTDQHRLDEHLRPAKKK
jgi:hypothetical protein